MKKLMLPIALTMSLGFGSGITQAATLTFAYEGVIDQTDGGAAFDAFLGETLRIEYTFNDTAMGNVDTDPSSSIGEYTLSAFTATVGGNSYSGGDTGFEISNNAGSSLARDVYIVFLQSAGAVGPAIGGLPFNDVSLSLRDNTGTALSSDELPLIQPDPSAFETTRLRIGFDDGFSEGILQANIVTVSAVPVPAAVWLFGSGLLGLIGVARRQSNAKPI